MVLWENKSYLLFDEKLNKVTSIGYKLKLQMTQHIFITKMPLEHILSFEVNQNAFWLIKALYTKMRMYKPNRTEYHKTMKWKSVIFISKWLAVSIWTNISCVTVNWPRIVCLYRIPASSFAYVIRLYCICAVFSLN